MINFLHLLGVVGMTALSGINSIDTQHNSVSVNDTYSVSLTDTSNYHYLSGSFIKSDYTWGYSLPTPETLTNAGTTDRYLSAFTLFQEDSVYYSSVYSVGLAENGFFPKVLFTDIAEYTNYYFGFIDLINVVKGGQHWYVQYWNRFVIVGNLSLNADIRLDFLSSMPGGPLGDQFPGCYSYAMNFDFSYFNFNGGSSVSKYIYRLKVFEDCYSVYGMAKDGRNYSTIYTLSSNYANFFTPTYIGTTGVSLNFHPIMISYTPNPHYVNISGDTYITNKIYTGLWEDIYPQYDELVQAGATTGLASPRFLFTLDYSRVDYQASVNYQSGYQDGEQYGYDRGEVVGYQQGLDAAEEDYQSGYADGFAAADSGDAVATTIFTGIIDVGLIPINFFLACLNFEVFGINIGGLVSSFLTVAIVVIIIRMITGSKQSD